MSMSSDELNYLIFRYLQESAFVHTAFVFAYESLVGRSCLGTVDIPPGTLICLLQKGLQYLEIENELAQHGQTDMTNAVCLLSGSMEGTTLSLLKNQKIMESMELDDDGKRNTNSESTATTMNLMSKISRSSSVSTWVPHEDVTELQGHTAEVLTCAWNPMRDALASGSGDSTVRIWNVPRGASGLPSSTFISMNSNVLKRTEDVSKTNNESKPSSECEPTAGSVDENQVPGVDLSGATEDITTLDWKPDGKLLAAGSYDGCARIFGFDGELENALNGHLGTIFSIRWSLSGNYLASVSVDKTVIVWDPSTGEIVHKFEHHQAPVLDVDWKDDEVLATCSTDKQIHIYRVGDSEPIAILSGHSDDINAVQWNDSGSLLASCSDDDTAKIWRPDAESDSVLVHNLDEHTRDVYQIRWAPHKDDQCGPEMLATASFDATIKLWDAETGRCLRSLSEHTKDVYSVDFSPCGNFLASGSSDATLRIWNVKDGTCVSKYRGGGRVFEVCWNKDGDKVAACFGLPGNCVSVIDFRK